MLLPEKLDLRSFITSFLERSGAVLEEVGYGLVETLLSDEQSPHFSEQMLLAFDYEVARENPAAIFVTYGSPMLDTTARLAADYGRYTVLHCPDLGFNQSRRFDREISEKLEFLHCRPPKVVYQWLADHLFWCFYFRAVFHSYEKTEDLLPVVLDGYTGLPAPDFDRWWSKIVPSEKPQYKLACAESLSLKGLYGAACREARIQAEEKSKALQLQAAYQMSREMTKVASYYSQTVNDIEKKIKATEDDAKKERLQKQMAATRADWQRREKDTLERYAVDAELHLDHLIACHLPRVHIKLELQNKDRLLNALVLYNPLAGQLELPVCQLCHKPAARLAPDREGRLICASHD